MARYPYFYDMLDRSLNLGLFLNNIQNKVKQDMRYRESGDARKDRVASYNNLHLSKFYTGPIYPHVQRWHGDRAGQGGPEPDDTLEARTLHIMGVHPPA